MTIRDDMPVFELVEYDEDFNFEDDTKSFPCDNGTTGCSIDHQVDENVDCATW